MRVSNVADIQLSCVECHRDFTWTVKEQIYYQMNQYQQPKHCRDCRRKKRELQTENHVAGWLKDRDKEKISSQK